MKIRLSSSFILEIIPETCYCVTAKLSHSSGLNVAIEKFSNLAPLSKVMNWANNKVNNEGEKYKTSKILNNQ